MWHIRYCSGQHFGSSLPKLQYDSLGNERHQSVRRLGCRACYKHPVLLERWSTTWLLEHVRNGSSPQLVRWHPCYQRLRGSLRQAKYNRVNPRRHLDALLGYAASEILPQDESRHLRMRATPRLCAGLSKPTCNQQTFVLKTEQDRMGA